jgi:predicted ArsR family transcriptional regulator
MKNTRQRILDYLGDHRSVTADELSHALHMTAANIRYHLSILRQRGLITARGERPSKGRGRPAKVYGLPHHKMGENLGLLASALLTEAMDAKDPREQKEFLSIIARLIVGKFQPATGLSQQLLYAVKRLNELNYQARWEAHADAPTLIFGHCPYLSILPDHPELCILDVAILENMLAEPVSQRAKLAHDSDGGTYCMFKLHK